MVRRIRAVTRFPPLMKTVRSLPSGARGPVVDNSGARMVQIISVLGHKVSRGGNQSAAIGDMVVVSVIKGKPEVRKKVMRAIIVQTRQKFRRPSGLTVHFEKNAAVLVDEDGNPKGTEIKGAVAREAVERWPGVGKVASVVV